MNPNLAEVGKATRFRKGQSGNPRGRPANLLTAELKAILAQPAQGSAHTHRHMVAWKMIQRAEAGDVAAARLIWEYVEGKPTQPFTFDLDAAAERLAAERGIDKGALLDFTRRLAAQAG